MYRWLRLSCLFLGTALLALGVVGYFRFWDPVMLLLACVGLALSILALRLDLRKNEANAESRKLAVQARLVKLKQEASQPAPVFVFACASSSFGLLLQSLAFALLGTFLLSSRHWFLIALAILSLTFAFSAAFRLVAEWGDRRLVLNSQGLAGLGFGLIPWSAVKGISSQEMGREKGRMSALLFFVPGLPTIMDRRLAHPWKRWICPFLPASMRDRLMFRLKPKGEYLEVVEEIARRFWQNASGQTQAWLPTGSDELNNALRQQAELTAEIARIDFHSVNTQEALDQLKQRVNENRRQTVENQRIINRELGNLWGRSAWIGGLLLAGWFLFVLYKLFNR